MMSKSRCVGGGGLYTLILSVTSWSGPNSEVIVRLRFMLMYLLMSRVFDSKVFVCESTSGAVFVLKPDRFGQRVALGEVDPVSRSVEGHDCVLVHVCVLFVVEVVFVHLVNLLVCVTFE